MLRHHFVAIKLNKFFSRNSVMKVKFFVVFADNGNKNLKLILDGGTLLLLS